MWTMRHGPRLSVWLFSAAALALALGSGVVASARPATSRNNYYSYTDESGTLHVTNVPSRSRGSWTLWKSVERKPKAGDERVSDAPAGVGRKGSVNLGAERFHRYDTFIRGAASRYQLPESLIRAVVHTESNYHSRATSRAGAMGLMQLMPKTARALGVKDAFDPKQNIFGGSRYLRLLANRYNGDMVLVLAAYNAGAGNVQKYGGVPPFAETRAYVRSVLRRFYAYERQAQLGAGSKRRGPARNIAP
ncbi:MAG: lytic transglycosylase domain-containing protein [Nannocystaceae bacterium]|nr:lytic transglycosylase domain-containing protein [bacterium]